jgi:hypothetical protein
MLPFYLFISEFSHAKSDWTDAEFFLAHRYSKPYQLINTSFIDTVYDILTTLEESTLLITVLRILDVYLGSGFFHLGYRDQKAPNPGSGFGLDSDSIRLVDSDPDLESRSLSVFSLNTGSGSAALELRNSQSIFKPKNFYYALRNMIRDVFLLSGIRFFLYSGSGSRIQG